MGLLTEVEALSPKAREGPDEMLVVAEEHAVALEPEIGVKGGGGTKESSVEGDHVMVKIGAHLELGLGERAILLWYVAGELAEGHIRPDECTVHEHQAPQRGPQREVVGGTDSRGAEDDAFQLTEDVPLDCLRGSLGDEAELCVECA